MTTPERYERSVLGDRAVAAASRLARARLWEWVARLAVFASVVGLAHGDVLPSEEEFFAALIALFVLAVTTMWSREASEELVALHLADAIERRWEYQTRDRDDRDELRELASPAIWVHSFEASALRDEVALHARDLPGWQRLLVGGRRRS